MALAKRIKELEQRRSSGKRDHFGWLQNGHYHVEGRKITASEFETWKRANAQKYRRILVLTWSGVRWPE